jgi:hypothetical protein
MKSHFSQALSEKKLRICFESLPEEAVHHQFFSIQDARIFIFNERLSIISENDHIAGMIQHLEVNWDLQEPLHYLSLFALMPNLINLVLSCNTREIYYREIFKNLKLPPLLQSLCLAINYLKEIRQFNYENMEDSFKSSLL